MGKILIFALGLALVGCTKIPENQPTGTETVEQEGPQLYVDPETGCEYLRQYGMGTTPRLGADGLPRCKGQIDVPVVENSSDFS